MRTSDGFDYITNPKKICFLSNMDQWRAHGEGRRSTEPPFELQIFKICRRQYQHHDQFVPLDMKGCICHFTKWQIHHFISEGTNNWYLDKREKIADTVCVQAEFVLWIQNISIYHIVSHHWICMHHFIKFLYISLSAFLYSLLARQVNPKCSLQQGFLMEMWYIGYKKLANAGY